MRQANLQIAVAEPRLEDPRWEPLFDLLEQSGIVLSFHVTVFPKAGDAFDKYKGSPGATFLHAKMFIEQFLDPFVDLFAWGILERHPKLKIVIAESGVGWVPWVVEELDYRYWRLWECKEFWDDKGGIPHKMKPSEVFQRQVYGTFQQSPTAMRLLEFWGPENLLWASDYPHPDSIWPNSVRTIGETMGHMDPNVVRGLVGGNAAKLYGLDLSQGDRAREAADRRRSGSPPRNLLPAQRNSRLPRANRRRWRMRWLPKRSTPSCPPDVQELAERVLDARARQGAQARHRGKLHRRAARRAADRRARARPRVRPRVRGLFEAGQVRPARHRPRQGRAAAARSASRSRVEMAHGALRRSQADIALSITGFAGPAGPDDEEGLVHFACARRGGETRHREEHFGTIGRDGRAHRRARGGARDDRAGAGGMTLRCVSF